MPTTLLNIQTIFKKNSEQIESIKQALPYIKQSFLFYSVQNGDIDLINAFLEDPISTKIVIDLVDNNNNTLLIIATSYGHLNIVDLLLQKGADPIKANEEGVTPLHIAAANGSLKLFCKLLFKIWSPLFLSKDFYNFITNFRTKDGNTILHIAAKYGNNDVIKLILYLCLIKFNLLIVNKDEEQVERIIRLGEVDYKKYYFRFFSKLLKKGNFNIVPKDDKTSKDNGTSKNDEKLIEDMLNLSSIALTIAERFNDSVDDFIKLGLFKKDPKELLDLVNNKGETPLHLAAKNGYMLVVETLKGAGANCNILDNQQNMAVDLACKYKYYHVAAIILGKIRLFLQFLFHRTSPFSGNFFSVNYAPNQPPNPTPNQTPNPTPNQTPNPTPKQTPKQTPNITPHHTPDSTPTSVDVHSMRISSILSIDDNSPKSSASSVPSNQLDKVIKLTFSSCLSLDGDNNEENSESSKWLLDDPPKNLEQLEDFSLTKANGEKKIASRLNFF